MSKMNNAVDKILDKAISRKLMVFLIGTFFFAAHFGLTSSEWMSLAIAYVGTQGFLETVMAYRSGPAMNKNIVNVENVENVQSMENPS